MKKKWHYLYVIFYPALSFKCYYGSRISHLHPDEDIDYFGSSVTFAHYNDTTHPEYQPDALKVIIWAQHLIASKKNGLALAELEAGMIKQALAESGAELCLNRNYAGRIVMTPAEQKNAWEKSAQNGSGFLNMSKSKHAKWALMGGLKSFEQGKGIHGMSEEKLQEARAKGNKVISEKYAKVYTFKSPAGELITFKNLRAFCRENNLQASHMRSLNIGKIRSHKGWRRPEEDA